MIGDVVKIRKDNVEVCEDALTALRKHLVKLAKMTDEYPVECNFGGYRFVFTCESDITDLISCLDEKISAYRRTAA